MKNKLLWLLIVAPVIVLGSMLAYPYDAQAIPAFARTHKVPCSTCHIGFPKLDHFGMEFDRLGFRMPGEKGKFLWEQPIPLAGRINLDYEYSSIEFNPQMPMMGMVDEKRSGLGLFDVQLLTGGTLAPMVSFFGQFVYKVNGLGPDATDAIDATDPSAITMANTLESETRIEAFFVQLDDLLPDAMMNLRIGKDHVDNHFLCVPLRLTRASRLIQFQTMLGASLHPMALGAELNGTIPFGRGMDYKLDYNLGVRNYGPAYDSKEDNEQRFGAFYAFVNQHIKKQIVSFMVTSDRRGDANEGTDDNTLGYGVSLDLHLGDLNIIPGYFWYHEGAKIRSGDKLDVTSGTVEMIYPILPTLLGTLRYDFNNWDIKNESLDRDAQQYVISLAWYQFPNVRWVMEYGRFNTTNLMLMQDEPGLQMLMPTTANTDL
ncbi:MAG: hypothetical protein V3U16_06550, partial [Candidatus Neomarinimicrobiota bacterium]